MIIGALTGDPEQSKEPQVVRTPTATPEIAKPIETIVIPTATPTDAQVAEISYRRLAEQMKADEEAAFARVDHKAASQYAAKRVEYEQLAEMAKRGVTPVPQPNNLRTLQTPYVTVTPAQTQEPRNKAGFTAQDIQVLGSIVDELVQKKVITRIDYETREVFIEPDVWTGLQYDKKKQLAGVLGYYLDAKARRQTDTPLVHIRDAYSGKQLAKNGVWGFSNEEE